jgi:hypothetical protein
MTYNPEEPTEPAALPKKTLANAARRFGVARWYAMTKADLVESLEYTAWTPAAEAAHTYLREHRPERGQPVDTCALCFRHRDIHSGPVPGRFGWPDTWLWKLGHDFPQ